MEDKQTIVKSGAPLKPSYTPNTITNREQLKETLSEHIGMLEEGNGGNLIVQGPRGNGKTTLLKHAIKNTPDSLPVCYTPCQQYRTQYQVLQQLCKALTWEEAGTGHHTADLQRLIDERTRHTTSIVILDKLDFLLLNDGDELLYFLSRMEHSSNILVIGVVSTMTDIEEVIDDRAYSSFYPEEYSIEPYSADDLYKILAVRARKALEPRSLHREALTYIASSTQNAALAIQWLKIAAETASGFIDGEVVRTTRQAAHEAYAEWLLNPFTVHHQELYRIIVNLAGESGGAVTTGDVYEQYENAFSGRSEERLSNRRISDFIKHLEILDLIKAEYHYGGGKGKTREIRINLPV